MRKAVFNTKFANCEKYNGQIVDVINEKRYDLETRYDIMFNDGKIENNVYDTELEFSQDAIEMAETKLAIKNISKQLSYIRRRDRVCCSFGSDQEISKLTNKRNELRCYLRKITKEHKTVI
jgi:hypothetical protein